MKNIRLPGYEDYRAEIDLIAPQASRLIAIRRHMTARHPELLLRDLEEQLPADVFETFWPKLKENWIKIIRDNQIVRGWVELIRNRQVVRSEIKPFCLLKQDGVKPFAYVVAPDTVSDIRKDMSLYSGGLIPSFRMKFAAAANEPEISHWFIFFHELTHGLIGAHAVPYQKEHFYYKALEETVCDSFAALHTLRKFGERAIPYLHLAADMRLSTFYLGGSEYFTGPAIRAIADDYMSGKLDLSASGLEGGDGGFALAKDYACRNFLDAGDVAVYRHRSHTMNFLDYFLGLAPLILRECFTATAQEGQPPLMEVRTQSREWQKELYDRSQTIEADYTYPTRRAALAARIRERLVPLIPGIGT